jgi:hypothetical protein
VHTISLPSSQFWFLSALIVSADIIIALLLLLGVRRALLTLSKTKVDIVRILATLGFVLFGWLALALFLAGQGVFRSALNQPVPYIALALAIGIPILVGALFVRGSKPVREIIASVPQSQLVAFQFYRVIGATFLVLYAVGQLPGIFALPAGFGDVLVGLAALLIGTRNAGNDQLVTLWNWFGISDLLVALATGFLSAPSRFQMFSLDAPDFLIGSFPLVMIPIFAVPLSIVLHLASLTKMSPALRSATKQVATA